MKERAADPKKYLAGWCVVGLALATALVGRIRDHESTVFGGLLFAVAGWGMVSEAKVRKERPPDAPWVRWYHVTGLTAVVGAATWWLWRSTVT